LKIYPKCKDVNPNKPGNGMGVRSDGYVIPCCFFGSQQAFNQLSKFLGDDVKNIHLQSGKTLDEINKGEEFRRVEETWSTNKPLGPCLAACSDPEHLEEDRHSTGFKFYKRDLKRKS
jgi:hypothetical protein